MKYRIHYYSKLNPNSKGCMSVAYPKEYAEKLCRQLNKECPEMEHYLVEEPE